MLRSLALSKGHCCRHVGTKSRCRSSSLLHAGSSLTTAATTARRSQLHSLSTLSLPSWWSPRFRQTTSSQKKSNLPIFSNAAGFNVSRQHSLLQGRCRTLSSSSAAAATAEEDDDDSSNNNHEQQFVWKRRQGMRCVAIVAHVDHGKTSLVDQLLRAAAAASGGNGNDTNSEDRLLDSGDLEKERGITITSKVTRVQYQSKDNEEPVIINIADTPGHADFSAEVDRFLSVADGFVLLVDAAEGPKSQTKYVLKRALAAGLKPIVVLNKCDRPDAVPKIDSGETEHAIHDLFVALGASEKQLDHLTLYASARQGWVTDDPLQALELQETAYNAVASKDNEFGMRFLLDTILEQIPEPLVRHYNSPTDDDDEETAAATALPGAAFEDDKFSLATVTVGYDSFLGRTCSGRIASGSIGMNDSVMVLPRSADDNNESSQQQTGKKAATTTSTAPSSNITGVFVYEGIRRVPLSGRAVAGDVVTLAGVPDQVLVGDTLAGVGNAVTQPIDTPPLAPPTLSMDFGANDGPLAGQEARNNNQKGPTMNTSPTKVRDRLVAETDNNVTLLVEQSATDSDKTTVFARGELQLGILVEQMRREGFELVISPPRILTKTCPDTGETLEPFEEVIIDVDSDYVGAVVNIMTGDRKGTLMEMSESTPPPSSSSTNSDQGSAGGKSQLVFEIPSRGMLGGFRSELATATRGSAVVNHVYIGDRAQVNSLNNAATEKGKLVSNETGNASAYALSSLEARGTLFIAPGDPVYPGLVIGENAKAGDLNVNPVRAKEKTNMRTQLKDEKLTLAPPKKMSVEELIGYMSLDEMIEVTPGSVRLRKQLLDAGARDRAARTKAKQLRALKENKS